MGKERGLMLLRQFRAMVNMDGLPYLFISERPTGKLYSPTDSEIRFGIIRRSDDTGFVMSGNHIQVCVGDFAVARNYDAAAHEYVRDTPLFKGRLDDCCSHPCSPSSLRLLIGERIIDLWYRPMRSFRPRLLGDLYAAIGHARQPGENYRLIFR